MLPIEHAILEKLRSDPCCFDEVVTALPHFSWGEVFVAVDSCRETDGSRFSKSATRRIRSHLARGSRIQAALHDES